MERRLSAILAADVVGYTRLMEADEVQEQMAAGGGDIRFRVGVNIGDIIIDNDDIFGDGVNLAARLEAAAPEGGILISAAVHDHVAGKIDATFSDGGEQSFKNVSKPVQVWRWQPDGASVSEAPPLALSDKPSIAVLPFDNMSGDPEQEYFSDGITEDIITALSKFRWFFVTARNSTFAYKGQSPNVPQVARELGVQYVLEGSVRKVGKRVRITGQLIDALSGNHIWAERYDRELDDIFELQDEITSAITGAVAPELADTLRARSVQKAPESLDAWDLHNRAMWHLYRFNKEDAAAAEELFERAIAADPSFAAAHASLAYHYYLDVVLGYSEAPPDSLEAGLKAAKRAVELDEKDSLGHCMIGRILCMYGQHDASIAATERALDLNPNSFIVRLSMGMVLTWAGRNEEAVAHFDESLRLSPNDPAGWASENVKAACLAGLERYDEALAAAQRAIQYPTADFWPRAQKAFVLARMGKIVEAKAALVEARDMRPDLSVALLGRMLSGFYAEGKSEYLDEMRKIGLPEE